MADNSLGKAQNFGSLGGKKRVNNSVGRTDKVDFYQFNVTGTQTISLKCKSSRFSSINLSLLSSTGDTITKASRSKGRIKPISTTLQAGTYYIQIRSRSDSPVRYSLVSEAVSSSAAPPSGAPPSPSGSFLAGSTTDIGTFTSTRTFQAQTVETKNNSKDFYRFTLPQIGSFNATVSNVNTNASIRLYVDSNKNGVADSGESFESGSGSNGSSSPISTTALPAGNYILEVSPNSFNVDFLSYDLTLSTTLNPGNVSLDPGSEAPTAFFLGNLPNTLVAKDYVGSLDQLDVYRFTTGASLTPTNINVGNLSDGTVSVTLFQDSNANNLIDSGERVTSESFSSGRLNQSISKLLDAGTYFVNVERSSSTDIAYTLTVQG
jgi:Bacterial pre-peptidase C-terminal domain